MQGKNPDRWLDVKDSLPLLAQRQWYTQLPHGYARGWEPVRYVTNIRTYYEILNWLTLEDGPGADRPEQPADTTLHTAADSDNRISM